MSFAIKKLKLYIEAFLSIIYTQYTRVDSNEISQVNENMKTRRNATQFRAFKYLHTFITGAC